MSDTLLIVDDDPAIITGLQALLEGDWEVRTALNGREARAAFAAFSPDVALLDMNLPDVTGLELLNDLKMYSEAVAVIMMSGQGTFDRVVESMRLGAETFLQKPFDYDTLALTLAHVKRMIATRRELQALRRADSPDVDRLPGISPAVQRLNELLAQVAGVPSPVLIEGESGTGKGVYAHLIHNRSPRARGPFVDLNCAGLSKELLESELFGHERGAFTNAMNTKPGLFEVASDGTLFLDEIGEMDVTVQARLLKAIEEKRFRRVGGIRDLTANFRLVAATNRDLAQEAAAGRFRSDLYYRLNVVRVRMPPLRERPEDIPVLVEVMLRPLAKEIGKPLPTVSPRALKKLEQYGWPGNVRELRNVLERATLHARGDRIDARLIEMALERRPAAADNEVLAAIERNGGDKERAAREMGISRATLYRRLSERR